MDHLNNFITAIRALLSSNIDTNNPINPEAIEEIIKICEPSLPTP